MIESERLFTRPSTLTDAERSAARLALEEAPALWETLYRAALGNLDHGDEVVIALLGRLRCSES